MFSKIYSIIAKCKITNIIGVVFIVLSLSACEILEKEPLNAVPETDLWNNEVLLVGYLNDLYYFVMPEFPGVDFNSILTSESSMISDESVSEFNTKEPVDVARYSLLYGLLTPNGNDVTNIFGREIYGSIRKINKLLEELPKSTADPIVVKYATGQALFLRAWLYYRLVINYGGIPMVLESQLPYDGDDVAEEALVYRKSTKECVEIIANDLDLAFKNLPPVWLDEKNDYGRIIRGAALALKGRLLLFWASPQFNPENKTERWQWAYEANKMALDTLQKDGYGLHNSFSDLFNNCTERTKEAILVRQYTTSNTTFQHSYNNGVIPSIFSYNGGGKTSNPTYNLVTAFPMIDGYPSYASSSEFPFDSTFFWLNRDPRLDYTVAYNSQIYPFSENPTFQLWSYFYRDANKNWLNALDNSEKNVSLTGFYCKKYIHPGILKINTNKVGTDWIEIRYAEVLLNFAECANELEGKGSEVRDALNHIRNDRDDVKVGMGYIDENIDDKTLMREVIMTERQVELAFENKRHWDLRRRNMFSQDLGPNIKRLNGSSRYGWRIEVAENLSASDAEDYRAQIDWSAPNINNYKTIFSKSFQDTLDTEYKINFKQPEYNFYPIPTDDLLKNPNLQQTKYWGGDFDPFDE